MEPTQGRTPIHTRPFTLAFILHSFSESHWIVGGAQEPIYSAMYDFHFKPEMLVYFVCFYLSYILIFHFVLGFGSSPADCIFEIVIS